MRLNAGSDIPRRPVLHADDAALSPRSLAGSLLIALLVYFVAGAYYQWSQYGSRGWDLLPNRAFWVSPCAVVCLLACLPARPRTDANLFCPLGGPAIRVAGSVQRDGPQRCWLFSAVRLSSTPADVPSSCCSRASHSSNQSVVLRVEIGARSDLQVIWSPSLRTLLPLSLV